MQQRRGRRCCCFRVCVLSVLMLCEDARCIGMACSNERSAVPLVTRHAFAVPQHIIIHTDPHPQGRIPGGSTIGVITYHRGDLEIEWWEKRGSLTLGQMPMYSDREGRSRSPPRKSRNSGDLEGQFFSRRGEERSGEERGGRGGGGDGCYTCGQEGHRARDCPQGGGSGGEGSRGFRGGGGAGAGAGQCFQCGGVGHLARDCPSARGVGGGGFRGGGGRSGGGGFRGGGGRGGGGDACFTCGKEGHRARDCPEGGGGGRRGGGGGYGGRSKKLNEEELDKGLDDYWKDDDDKKEDTKEEKKKEEAPKDD